MKTVDNRQSAHIVGLEFGLTSLPAHSGDGHPSKPRALAQHLSEAGQLHGICHPNLVRLALLVSASSCMIGLAGLWLRKKQYDLEVSQVALAYAQAAAECPDDESWDAEASLVNAFADRLREIPRKRLICSARNFRSNLLTFVSRQIGRFLFGWLTVAINRLGNFRDQIKRLVLGFHRTAVGIVKADNKPFTRKAVFRIFERHKGSSSVVGLDDSTMDEAGGSGNAATSRVEVLRGQCGRSGWKEN